MAPRRQKKKVDEDVIRTEPDQRRAACDGDDHDKIDSDVQPAFSPDQAITSRSEAIYWRNVYRRTMPRTKSIFRLMELPAEVRNRIYKYLLVSGSGSCIRLDLDGDLRAGGIETAILRANHQVYSEAIHILYNENHCKVVLDGGELYPISIREDWPHDLPTRKLRSGREVDMMGYSGLIYEKSLFKIRHFVIDVDLTGFTNLHPLQPFFCRSILGWFLTPILMRRYFRPTTELVLFNRPTAADWRISVQVPPGLEAYMDREALGPLRQGHILFLIQEGLLSL